MLNIRQVQQIMQNLRNVAERHPDDVIANRASDFAWRLETAGGVYGPSLDPNQWAAWELELAKYAARWNRKQEITA